MRIVHKLLNRLARHIVKNAESCTLWAYDDHKDVFSFCGLGSNGFLGRGMQRAFPQGGWSWWRLLEIMDHRLPCWLEPKDWDMRMGH